MAMFKLLNGERVEMTAEEVTAREADEIEATRPLKQEEIDAELDALTDAIDQGQSVIRALAVEVFQLAKAAEPKLTPKQFKTRIRDRIKGFSNDR